MSVISYVLNDDSYTAHSSCVTVEGNAIGRVRPSAQRSIFTPAVESTEQ